MIKGIVFDKDGTLFDFNATWGAWTRGMIATEAGDDPEKIETLANALGYDFEGGVFWPESIVIAETVDFIADALIEHLPDVSKKDLMTRMHKAAKNVPQVQAAPLWPLLNEIKEMDILLGVATAITAPASYDEMKEAGIEGAPCENVAPPRVKASPVALECKLIEVIDLPKGKNSQSHVVLGQVVGIHIDDDIITDGIVDVHKMELIARLGYLDYAKIESENIVALPRPDTFQHPSDKD